MFYQGTLYEMLLPAILLLSLIVNVIAIRHFSKNFGKKKEEEEKEPPLQQDEKERTQDADDLLRELLDNGAVNIQVFPSSEFILRSPRG
jgi:flagellar biosynthesis/type III secretory pathway M-ring protein FliF/YscJ